MSSEHLGEQFDGVVLHRGLNVKLEPEHQEQVRSLLKSPTHPDEFNQHLKIGPMLVDILSQYQGRASSGLGHHWTSRMEMAETAGHAGNVGGMPIIVSARHRTRDVETDPGRLVGNQFSGEAETTLKPGSQFDITDVRIPRGGQWESVWDTEGRGTGREAWAKEYDSEYKPEDWD